MAHGKQIQNSLFKDKSDGELVKKTETCEDFFQILLSYRHKTQAGQKTAGTFVNFSEEIYLPDAFHRFAFRCHSVTRSFVP